MSKEQNKEQEQPPRLWQRLNVGAIDVLAAVGLGLFSYGAWLVYEPLGFLAAGALLLGAVVTSARRR